MFTTQSFPGGLDCVFTIDEDKCEIAASNNFLLHVVWEDTLLLVSHQVVSDFCDPTGL